MSTPPPNPLCPECGTPTTAPPLILPFWIRARRLTQAVVLLMALCFVAYEIGAHWPRLTNPFLHNPAIVAVDFPPEQFTRHTLEAMADDASAAGNGERLIRAMQTYLDSPIADGTQLMVAFIKPTGESGSLVQYGWPRSIVSYRFDATFDDVYARTGVTPQPLRARSGWISRAHWREWLDPRRGRATRLIMPRQVTAGLLVVALGWLSGTVLRASLQLARLTNRTRQRRRDRVAHRIPLASVLAALIVVVALSLERRDDQGITYPPPPWPLTAPTGLYNAQLRALQSTPNSDRLLARAILDAADTIPSTGDTLAWGWHNSRAVLTAQYQGGWPRGVFNGNYTEFERRQTSEPSRVTWTPGLGRGFLTLHGVQTGPVERAQHFSLSLAALATPLLCLLAIWILAGLPARLALWRLNRRTRRRAARQLCLRCGYPLAPSKPHE